MTSTVRWIILGLVVAAGVAAWMLTSPELQIERLTKTGQTGNGPAMCPWRNPEQSMRAFFPGSTGYRTDLFALGALRQKILRQLGPGSRLETNVLYAYRILKNESVLGAVLVRRASGPHGAIEVVAAVSRGHEIVGVQIQRQREPDAVARAIESESWLLAFKGKKSDSDFTIGAGLPEVPVPAKPAARAVADAVRSLLIEYAAADAAAPKGVRSLEENGAHQH